MVSDRNAAHTRSMSWLLSAQKMAEMHSPMACNGCGAVVALDAAACDRCGLPRGASAAQELVAAEPALLQERPHNADSRSDPGRAPAAPAGAPSFGRVCAACGAVVEGNAYWCRKCGESRIVQVRILPPMKGLSPSAKVGLAGAMTAAILALAVAGGSVVTRGSGGARGGSPSPALIGAVRDAGSSGTAARTAGSAASGVSSTLTTPLVTGNNRSDTEPAGSSPDTDSAAEVPTSAIPTLVAQTTTVPTPAAPTAASPTEAAPTSADTTFDTAGIAVEITSLPASITPGTDATLAALTSPGATCDAKVKYHMGPPAVPPGLLKKQVADPAGKVSWTWTVDLGTQSGDSTASVSCNLHGHAASKSKKFVVA
jgi:RNA polymerase subunit RPABC4/transcription elongation factor Spt4